MLTVQVERFRDGRLKLLEARLNAQAAELDTAVAKASQAADRRSAGPINCGNRAS